LRGKTPRTARKAAEPRQVSTHTRATRSWTNNRQPLASLLAANAQNKPSPAEQSLRNNLQKAATNARFQIAEDENTARAQASPAKTPVARQLFSKDLPTGKENIDTSFHADVFDELPTHPSAAPWSPMRSTQDTVMSSQGDDVFSPPRGTQSTQPTQPTSSFRHSIHDSEKERRDTGDSFVSAKEAFGSKNVSIDNMRAHDENAMEIDDEADNSRPDSQGTMIHHELSSAAEDEDESMADMAEFPAPPRVVSEQYSSSAETHEALDTAHLRAYQPEPKTLFAPESTTPSGQPPALVEDALHDDTVLHHDVDDQMDIDEEVRSPSETSSPVKPLVRKSSLTFASLPAREPLLAKKSMGNRVSRTSHIDPSKGRNSQMGRYTGGKSLGGSQLAHPNETHFDDMEVEDARPELQREESETTKIHNKTSTQRLFERINMLKQQNEVPKRISQNIASSQSSQPQSFTSAQTKEDVAPVHAAQPAYPSLPPNAPIDEDDDDDWISPVRTAAPAPNAARPAFSKSHTTHAPPSPLKHVPAKLVSVSNPDLPDLSAAAESTTPVGSPTTKKYMDAPLSASKAKFYSALRAAKEKIIGSSATSAQVKLDALVESPRKPQLQAHSSSDDVFESPKRPEKTGLFSRSPSKESNKSKSSKLAGSSSSPAKEDSRRTRSSTERQKQKDKETQDRDAKDAKQKQRAEAKLREMREKEQNKATLHHQKSKGALKTPSAMSSQSSLRQPATIRDGAKTPTSSFPQQQAIARPGVPRTNTASSREDVDSADEMPPPPAPKSLLPTTKPSKAALREPRKLTKPTSKDALPKAKAPQKIMVNLNSSRYGQAPPPAARPAPAASVKAAPTAPVMSTKSSAPVPKPTAASSRPASAMAGRAGQASRPAPVAKPAAPKAGRPISQVMDKAKATAPSRPDLGAARPVSRMQTVQDANRINVPPVNPAKPPKRPYEAASDETLHRPAKRPSQQAKMNPITPAHSQFAKGKIPFAESAHAPQSQPPTIQYPNGDDIKLPEIMTDSEDEDSENEFEQPSWVNTPNLREMLTNQQLMDPETIFGPIAPLNMEAVFPNKERHKRFRERTSSAFWANDQVTEEEKRKEREARERLVRDGAWTYNPSPRPAAGPSR
jgi:hypothetical protein